jgi:hypothetical protein
MYFRHHCAAGWVLGVVEMVSIVGPSLILTKSELQIYSIIQMGVLRPSYTKSFASPDVSQKEKGKTSFHLRRRDVEVIKPQLSAGFT